jgi:hypothetical protein
LVCFLSSCLLCLFRCLVCFGSSSARRRSRIWCRVWRVNGRSGNRSCTTVVSLMLLVWSCCLLEFLSSFCRSVSTFCNRKVGLLRSSSDWWSVASCSSLYLSSGKLFGLRSPLYRILCSKIVPFLVRLSSPPHYSSATPVGQAISARSCK